MRNIAAKCIEKVLQFYYATRRPETPTWAKSVVYGALLYFVSPIDVIPDFTPVFGYVDDLGVIIAALITISFYINDETREKAREKRQSWFGN